MIELLVVLSIVALLLTLSAPRYFSSIQKSKEVILKENLRATREIIEKFYADKGRYPESLQELVDLRYLRAMPIDPIADSATAWIVLPPKDPEKQGVYDLRSSANGASRDGVAYSNY